jgi:hypothetical protein
MEGLWGRDCGKYYDLFGEEVLGKGLRKYSIAIL